MPLFDAGTISNGYRGVSVAARNKFAGDNDPANSESPEVAASPATISRRPRKPARKSLRRLKVIPAKLLRTPFVRWTIRSQLAVNRKFFFGFIPLARAAVGHCEVVV